MDDDNISTISMSNYSLLEQRRINIDSEGTVTDYVVKRQYGDHIAMYRYELVGERLQLVEKKYKGCPTTALKENFENIWEILEDQIPLKERP